MKRIDEILEMLKDFHVDIDNPEEMTERIMDNLTFMI